MNKLLPLSLAVLPFATSVSLVEAKDSTLSVYGVGAQTDKDQSSYNGLGLSYDSEALKLKAETTPEFLKAGAVLKFNPFSNEWYIKAGANVVNQKMYAADNTSGRVNQYSGALAAGYMLSDDLYAELGASATSLEGQTIGADYEIKAEITKLAYLELAKRWNGNFGTIDATANTGQIYYEFADNQTSSGLGIDYYPLDNAKIGIKHQNELNNIINTLSLQYGMAFTEYTQNTSTETYQVTAGINMTFDSLLDISSYKTPTNIKPHLSELHRFESVSLGSNMNIQSSQGVKQKTIETPLTISINNQTVNDNGGSGGHVYTPTASDVTGVKPNAVYSLINDQTSGRLTIVPSTGSMTWSGDTIGNQFEVTIRVTNPDGGTASTTFTLDVIDNF